MNNSFDHIASRWKVSRGIFFVCCCLAFVRINAQRSFFVDVTNGRDNNPGTLERPLKTLPDALQRITRYKNAAACFIYLRAGTYELDRKITIDANTAGGGAPIFIKPYNHEKVVISGGRRLPPHWQPGDKKNTYFIDVSGYKAFHTLYNQDTAVSRCSSGYLLTNGPEERNKALYKRGDFMALQNLAKNNLDAFCSFKYNSRILNDIRDIENAEVIVYNSWEASWHEVSKIDVPRNVFIFKNPMSYPVGFFKDAVPYRIENSFLYFDQPGKWLLDKRSGKLWYYAKEGEHPNKMSFIIPQLDTLLYIKGQNNRPVNNIHFSNIIFAYSRTIWGISDFPVSYQWKYKNRYPWMDLNVGFASNQASLKCGAAILLQRAEHCSFTSCLFRNLGNYAMRIGEYAHRNTVRDCGFESIAGGGIIVGMNLPGGRRKNLPATVSPAFDTVMGNRITRCGTMFPSGVGIALMQANHCLVDGNTLSDLPYTGISVGWTWGAGDNYTGYNTISGNEIFNVMELLSDGAGIYTLGTQEESLYRNNYVHDIKRSAYAIGAPNNGFFFDQGSSGFVVEGNVVENISKGASFRENKTDIGRIHFKNNFFFDHPGGLSVREARVIKSGAGKK